MFDSSFKKKFRFATNHVEIIFVAYLQNLTENIYRSKELFAKFIKSFHVDNVDIEMD